MRNLVKAALFALVVAGTGAAAGCGPMRVSGTVSSTAYAYPDNGLVEVEPGVYAVVDSGEPVYYYGNEYYVVRGGTWYRRPMWNRPWVRVSVGNVPRRIVYRDHRTVVHVRPNGRRVIHARPGKHRRGDGVVIRDHRR